MVGPLRIDRRLHDVYLAEADGEKLQCVTRGKKTNVAVGDQVVLTRTSADQGVIDEISERRTLLYRSDQYKSKLLAANLTQLFIVVATEPGFADDLVSRALVAAEAAGIKAHLILKKIDVVESLDKTRERVQQVIDELGASGETEPVVDGVVVCACGFVSDHLEVLYDLDIEARARAARHGLGFARAASVNEDPAVMMMVMVLRAQLSKPHVGISAIAILNAVPERNS